MKRILAILLFIMIGRLGWGKCENAVITFSPAEFTAEDQVTMTIDFSGCPDFPGSDIFLWLWEPNPLYNQGSWDASSEDAKMTKISDKVYQFNFQNKPLTEFYKKSPAELKSFNFLAKDRTGTWQTTDQTANVKPLTFEDFVGRTFPATVSASDVITVYLNQEVAEDPDIRYYGGKMKLVVKAIGDGTELGVSEPMVTHAQEDGNFMTYSASFIPDLLFPDLPEEAKIEKLVFVFQSPDASVKSDEIDKALIELK